MPVSVIIPAFDAAKDLDRNLPALRSEAPDVEILVVDDGSRDDTAAAAARHGARVLRQPNRGPAAARNHGAREAAGDVLVFLDADCRVTAGWLAALLAPLRSDAVAAVKGAYLTEQKSTVARLCQVEFEERYDLLRSSHRVDFVDSFSMAIRKAVFLGCGGFDETFLRADNEDVDLSFRLDAAGHGLAFAPDARVHHHHPDTFRKYARLKLSRGYYRARVYERYPGKAARDAYTPASLKLQAAVALLGLLALPGGPLLALATMTPTLAATALLGPLVALLLIAASGASFLRRARRDQGVSATASASFLVVRALAIASGVLARALRLPGPRPKGD